MNICFFNQQEEFGAATVDGRGRATSLLAKELRRRGHCVEFYFQQPLRRFHVPVVSALLASFFFLLSIPHFLPSSQRSASKRFRKFLKEHKIDLAVAHGGTWFFLLPLNNFPCKLVTVWHNTPIFTEHAYANMKPSFRLARQNALCRFRHFLSLKWSKFLRSRLLFYAVRHGDKFVLLSEGFIPEFAPAKKFPEKVCAIHNIAPFDAQNVDFSSKKKELLWVSRLVYRKKADLMLRIWCKLQDRLPDWSLRLVGKGPCLDEMKVLAKELGVQRVFFEGHQDPTPHYRSAPIFCMTSTFEGFGLTLVEAQAYGCVPVAFDSYSTVHDIIEDGVNGYLIPPFNLDAYAEKLAQLMQDSELRERLAENGQKSIAKFSAEAIGEKWEKLFKELQLS